MTNECDENGKLLHPSKRITKFGRILRRTSLDELAGLFNVFNGTMSIIGPRPLMKDYLPLYNERHKHRHDVRPGLTGLAQVSGRNAISWETRFAFDVKYVENISFLNDIKIISATVFTVLKRNGISSETSDTMEDFKGSSIEEKIGYENTALYNTQGRIG
jgi:lipopolysaccharide/colanic/teichoic acid biosynthesis glycosyltransferase